MTNSPRKLLFTSPTDTMRFEYHRAVYFKSFTAYYNDENYKVVRIWPDNTVTMARFDKTVPFGQRSSLKTLECPTPGEYDPWQQFKDAVKQILSRWFKG